VKGFELVQVPDPKKLGNMVKKPRLIETELFLLGANKDYRKVSS